MCGFLPGTETQNSETGAMKGTAGQQRGKEENIRAARLTSSKYSTLTTSVSWTEICFGVFLGE